MNQERLMQIIQGPIVSETSTRLGEKHEQVVFKVLPNANKKEIKAAVELLLNVEVKSVTTALQKGKTKRFGRYVGRRSDVKKAFVSLADGARLDLEAAAAAQTAE